MGRCRQSRFMVSPLRKALYGNWDERAGRAALWLTRGVDGQAAFAAVMRHEGGGRPRRQLP
jgi:hypothetical protein